MKRLRKLEGIVEELSGQIEVESVRHPYSAGNSPEASRDDHPMGPRLGNAPSIATVSAANSGGSNQDSPSPSAVGGARLPGRPASGTMSEPDSLLRKASSPDVHKQFGRLVLNEKGVTRYVSSSLWSSITDEVCQSPV